MITYFINYLSINGGAYSMIRQYRDKKHIHVRKETIAIMGLLFKLWVEGCDFTAMGVKRYTLTETPWPSWGRFNLISFTKVYTVSNFNHMYSQCYSWQLAEIRFDNLLAPNRQQTINSTKYDLFYWHIFASHTPMSNDNCFRHEILTNTFINQDGHHQFIVISVMAIYSMYKEGNNAAAI